MKRTWVISWFEWNGEKAVGTKTIYKTVNCNNYTDREAEKYSLKEETLFLAMFFGFAYFLLLAFT